MSSLFKSGLSRRAFMRSLGVASVAAASVPAFAAVTGAVARPQSRGLSGGDGPGPGWTSDEIVQVSTSENPLGPAPAALEAVAAMAAVSNRYHGDVVQSTV